jgi:hypothetical protein
LQRLHVLRDVETVADDAELLFTAVRDTACLLLVVDKPAELARH